MGTASTGMVTVAERIASRAQDAQVTAEREQVTVENLTSILVGLQELGMQRGITERMGEAQRLVREELADRRIALGRYQGEAEGLKIAASLARDGDLHKRPGQA